MDANDTILRILDLARWAPSGDNTQPWRFEIVSGSRVVVHGFDTREHCIYDLDGRASQISLGALLETVQIAAADSGYTIAIQRRGASETRPTFEVALSLDPAVRPDPLARFIRLRTVQRRALKTRRLRADEKTALEGSLGEGYEARWFEGFRQRYRVARLLFANAKLRLTLREAYEVHRRVIEWGARFSETKIPDQAVGLDPVATRLMQWAMVDWRRVQFFNRYLAGTVLPRLQLDFLPGLACAAHVLIVARSAPTTIDDYIAAGRAVQRFWLTATALGLRHQPSFTPLVFAAYARERRQFSAEPSSLDEAGKVAGALQELIGDPDTIRRAVWLGRLGEGSAPQARSLRLPIDKLLHAPRSGP